MPHWKRLARLQKKMQSKIESVEIPQVNWKAICIVGFFIAIALLVFYVWEIVPVVWGLWGYLSYIVNCVRLGEIVKGFFLYCVFYCLLFVL